MKKNILYLSLLLLPNLVVAQQLAADSKNLSQLESEENIIERLKAKNEELQFQQDILLKKIVTLKQRLDKTPVRIEKEERRSLNSQEEAELQKLLEQSNEQLEKEKEKVRKLADYILDVRKQMRMKDEQVAKLTTENSETKNKFEDLQGSYNTCKNTSLGNVKAAETLTKTQMKVSELEQAISFKETDLKACISRRDELEVVANTSVELKKELLATKNELLMKDAQLDQFGKKTKSVSVVEPRKLAEANTVVDHQRGMLFENSGLNAGLSTLGKKTNDPLMSDVTIVEVVGDKVALRSGPSPEDSEIMSVAKATRLTVEERTGEWYRVVAPNSMRAFIRADMVKVISGNGNNSDLPTEPIYSSADSSAIKELTSSTPKKRVLRNRKPSNIIKKEKEDKAFDKIKMGLGYSPFDN